MAKDPAFLFYPGDYLRDTQCLSEKSQVAYDRIMCEHMRNICITQDQLNFFIKRLNEDEKKEVLMLLKKGPGGYQISWVAESICKRRAYSDSRRENKKGKHKNISKSYDSHMENAIVIENKDEFKEEGAGEENFLVPQMLDLFKKKNTKYPIDAETDLPSLLNISQKIKKLDNLQGWVSENYNHILTRWGEIVSHVRSDSHFLKYSLSQINKHFQSIIQSLNADGTNGNQHGKTKYNGSNRAVITGTSESAGSL